MDPKNHQKQAIESIRNYEEMVAACNRCGFCTSYCPTYNASGLETQSPRGRNQALRAILEGRLENPDDARQIFDSCLLCGECTSVCFSEVPTAELMIQARDYLNRLKPPSKALLFFLKRILPQPRRLAWVLRIAFLGKKLGMAWVFKKLGLLKRLSPALDAAQELTRDVPLVFLLERKESRFYLERNVMLLEHAHAMAHQKAAGQTKGTSSAFRSIRPRLAYLPVCGSQYLRPEIGVSTFKLLKHLRQDFLIPESICCGLPAASQGFIDRARAMARENILRAERGRFENLIVDDSSCAAHFKDYPKLFREDTAWLGRAHAFAQKVREMSSFLLQKGLKEPLLKTTWTKGPVAYHDPCKAQYAQKITQPPRELLCSIKNLSLVPIPDSDQCCGGGGSYSFTHPEMSRSVLQAKIKNIMASEPRFVLTSSTSCLIQLAFGLRDQASGIEAKHINEFLADVLEGKK